MDRKQIKNKKYTQTKAISSTDSHQETYTNTYERSNDQRALGTFAEGVLPNKKVSREEIRSLKNSR